MHIPIFSIALFEKSNIIVCQHGGSLKKMGAQFVFCDGSVRLINYTVDLTTFQNVCSRKTADGNEH